MSKAGKRRQVRRRLKAFVPIYNAELHIAVGGDFDEEVHRMKADARKGFSGDQYGALAIELDGHFRYGIVFRDKPTIAMILHEAFHVSNWICRDFGIEKDYDNDEAQAYLIRWLYKRISTFVLDGK